MFVSGNAGFYTMQHAFRDLNEMPTPLGDVLDGAFAPGGEGGITNHQLLAPPHGSQWFGDQASGNRTTSVD